MQVCISTFKNFFPYVLNSLQKKSLVISRYILIDNKDWSVKFAGQKFLDSFRIQLEKILLS